MNQSTPGPLRTARTVGGVAVLVVSLWWLVGVVEGPAIAAAWGGLTGSPVLIAAAMLAYAAAFGVRTLAWMRVQPALVRGQAWAALHVSLLGNHVLPFRLGEILRVTSVLRRTALPPREVIAAVIALRLSDLLAVMAIASIATPVALLAIVGPTGAIGIGAALCVGFAVACWWLARTRDAARSRQADAQAQSGAAPSQAISDHSRVRLPGPFVLGAAGLAWLLEAAVLFTVADLAGLSVSPSQAAGVTAITVFAQVFALTPGGFGTYEAAGTAAMVALGFPAAEAFAVVLLTHGVKTAYALLVGAVALVTPAPGYWGRWRLPRHIPLAATSITAADTAPADPNAQRSDDRPVVVFLPAHNEEDVISSVLGRIPVQVHGHRVQVLVINDGSSDRTAVLAAQAGACVVDQPRNLGLGAAVRRGLQLTAEQNPIAGVYLDADGEYPPEQIGDVVEPVLTGEADYVIGSRFSGTIETMRPHRRIGNLALTRWVRWTARRPDVSDGQSGFRAFSPGALRAAEVVHDYNYAQVLTLDLLGKGFVYAEVPIRYRFRTTGTSFVSLGRYLRKVVPAVHRELNSA
ncbi:MAG: lysylphosphatidylglycerol synthase domain-containing protein [Ornithinimicrobium sp.]